MFCSISLSAQDSFLHGKVTDRETGEELIGANLVLMRQGIYVAGTATDFDGNYRMGVEKGTYDLHITYVGNSDQVVKGIVIVKKGGTKLNVTMIHSLALDTIHVTNYKLPLIGHDHTTSGSIITAEQIRNLPTKNVAALAATAAGSSSSSSSSPNVKGSRADATDYYIDGIRVSSSISLPTTITTTSDNAAPEIVAGTLTAGEIHDFSKWELWSDIAEEDLAEYQELWQMNPRQRVTLQLQNQQEQALADARVELLANGQIVWEARTDNTGKAELWWQALGEEPAEAKLSIRVRHSREVSLLEGAQFFSNGLNHAQLPLSCTSKDAVDIAFVTDATSSMRDEIRYLQSDMQSILERAERDHPNFDLRSAAVFYRDYQNQFPLANSSDFTANIQETVDFIHKPMIGGSCGDIPEAVEAGLHMAIEELSWREEARARLLFLILDAPPHDRPKAKEELHRLVRSAARKGIRIIPVSCSGVDKSTEYLMRAMALLTNGTYTFLTDDSGVGNPHLEPTTDSYEVEKFNDLIQRLIFQFTHQQDCSTQEAEVAALPAQWERKKLVEPSSRKSFKWSYYPNPSRGAITVKANRKMDELYVADVSGKIVKRIEMNGQKKKRIDLAELPSGLYLLMYEQSEGKWRSSKLVLEKGGEQYSFQKGK